MAISHKTQNLPSLVIVLLANLAVFYGFLLNGNFDIPAALALFANWKDAIPGPLAIIAVGVFSEQFGPEAKAGMLYWRWNDPLPASRSFSYYGPRDKRVDMEHIRAIVGTLPVAPQDQNRIWYQQLYKKVKNETSVAQASKKYLFYRDWTAINLFLVVILPIICVWRGMALQAVAVYFVLLITQLLLVTNAGRGNGIALVTNVMATV